MGEVTAEIRTTPLGHGRFLVEVIESLGWHGTPEELIRASFRFLLGREPKESILHAFDIEVIGNYFPEWEGETRRGFAGA